MENQTFHVQEKHPLLKLPAWKTVFAWQNILTYALTLCVLIGVFYTISPRREEALLRFVLTPISFGALALIAYNCEYLKFPEVKLMGAFFLWMIFATLLVDWQIDGPLSSNWACAVCVTTFLCFSAPYAFSRDQLRRTLRWVCTAAVIASFVLCATALLLVATGKIVVSSGGGELFGMGADGRLHLFCNPNTTGPLAALPMLLAVILLASAKKRITRIALLVAMAVFYVTLALSDSRTATYGVAAALGLCMFLYGNMKAPGKTRRWVRILTSAVAGIAVMVMLMYGTRLVAGAYNTYAQAHEKEWTADIAAQGDEETGSIQDGAGIQAIKRGSYGASSFNGRTDIWEIAVKYLCNNPKILLHGVGALDAGPTISPYMPDYLPKANFHNSFFSVLFAFGLPGLLLVLAFCVFLAIAAVKLMFCRLTDRNSLEARLIPTVLVYMVVEVMLEEFLFTGTTLNPIWTWFSLCAGMTFCFLRKEAADDKPCAAKVATCDAAMYNEQIN